jgi:hypothetical protein
MVPITMSMWFMGQEGPGLARCSEPGCEPGCAATEVAKGKGQSELAGLASPAKWQRSHAFIFEVSTNGLERTIHQKSDLRPIAENHHQ